MVKYSMDGLFASLADETRRDMLHRLLRGEQTITQLAEAYKISLVAVSKHVKVLEASGLITKEKRGRQWFVSLSPSALQVATEHLLHYEAALHGRLDSFKAYLQGNSIESRDKTATPASGQPQSIILTEVLNAGPEIVWQSYTDPASVRHWWNISGAQLMNVENDVRVGGVWRFTVQGANGHTFTLGGTYSNVERPHQLEYTDGVGEFDAARPEAHVTVTFKSLANGKTLLTKKARATPAVHRLNAAWYQVIGGG